ncbi:hypothetical protein GGTG_06627 [Gaeumannomyces tritici R3-111a-1]|uniref:FAD-binding FR-type domain-containing protein n=1 Tax=Gaeumannomyces tritici (strain R3-111a-1) TaxID=644352 RepID=J3NZC8_GAET3|nr:hypothetical protein GGTG_06627 [Gaeumannomyces tritici R3-111a-1]EJT76711.1 hypothetical protein GGTG_06627 [Gaeumannomyces tritici R3-111a-1]
MTPARVAAWLGLLALPTAAQYHLIGLGYLPYDPLFAESCLRSLSTYTLGCTPEMDMAGGHAGHAMSMTPPECFAADDAFLTSVAWCLHSKCADSGVPASKLESFWEQFVTGSAGRLPAKWTYSEALAAVDPRPPSRQPDASDCELNVTSVVNPVVYLMQWNVLGAVVDESKTESKYSLVIILVAVASPVLLTRFGFPPLVAPLMDKPFSSSSAASITFWVSPRDRTRRRLRARRHPGRPLGSGPRWSRLRPLSNPRLPAAVGEPSVYGHAERPATSARIPAVPAGRAAIEELADEERQMIGGETKSAALGHTARHEDSNNMAPASATGLTLFIKKGAGITRHLAPQDGLLALLDGPYYSNGRASNILRCDRVLVVAGGIGITGTLPWIYQHPNVKLAWSVAESARCLVEALDLDAAPEKEVKIGSRLDVRELVAREAEAGWAGIGIVVAGPGGLCDDVRAAVAEAGRQGRAVFELEVDAYSWRCKFVTGS